MLLQIQGFNLSEPVLTADCACVRVCVRVCACLSLLYTSSPFFLFKTRCFSCVIKKCGGKTALVKRVWGILLFVLEFCV